MTLVTLFLPSTVANGASLVASFAGEGGSRGLAIET